MPFIIVKNGPASKPYCCYTEGEDGKPRGDAHGCHPTEAQAREQQKALYHAVPEASKGAGDRPMRDYVIHFGTAAKALGNGKVGGYLVQFGGPDSADAEGEWFEAGTDFDTDFPARASIYYNHGLDPVIGRRRLGHGSMKLDDLGVWVEAQLNLADRHQAAMYRMAQAGKLGWSSGSLSHITEPPRDSPGGAIKSWPLGHDASLTPIPSDKRNLAVALKSWEPPPLEELAPIGGIADAPSASLHENTERWMDDGMFVLSGYQSIAGKAGRKLSASRRARLVEMQRMIQDLLSETAPREGDPEEEEAAPPPGMGEGVTGPSLTGAPAATAPGEIPVPPIHDLYAACVRQAAAGAVWGE